MRMDASQSFGSPSFGLSMSTFIFVAVTAKCPCTRRILMQTPPHASAACLPTGACLEDETCRDAAVRLVANKFGVAVPAYNLIEAGFASQMHGSSHHLTVCFAFDATNLPASFDGRGFAWLNPKTFPYSSATLTQAILLKQLARSTF